MFVLPNFETKAALDAAVARGKAVRVDASNVLVGPPPANGEVRVAGLYYPPPRIWYATVTLVNSLITKVE